MKIDKYNPEGYPDPTCYEAMCTMESKDKPLFQFRPIVYICSPYSGRIEENTIAARKYSRFAVDEGCIPIAPHLLFPQFLDDTNHEERQLGIFFGNVLMTKCIEIWVFGNSITDGMQAEIAYAKRRRCHIRYFNEQCEEVFP